MQDIRSSVVIFRFCIVFFLALLFGLERQRAHKPIGFGTFTFVATGSCGLALAAMSLNLANPLPLLSGIVTGIGFLGAGAMIKTSDKIFGFTTAASIWIFSIFGLLVGAGQYLTAGLVYCGVWAVVIIDKYLENRGIGSYQRKLIIKTSRIIPEKDIRNVFLIHFTKFKLIALEVDKHNNQITSIYLIEGRRTELNQIPTILYKMDWVDSCKIE